MVGICNAGCVGLHFFSSLFTIISGDHYSARFFSLDIIIDRLR
jgi:hypothetical protein